MNQAVDDCLISRYEHLIPVINLPDADDRHVVAAAIHGRADVIVTFNLKDFPATTLSEYRMEAQHPDIFIRHVLELDRQAIAAVRTLRFRLKRPPKTVDEYLITLEQQGLPETVNFLRQWKELL